MISRKIENLAARLRRRELVGSHDVALEVVSLYKEVINAARISSFEGLVEALHQVGRKLQDAGRKGELPPETAHSVTVSTLMVCPLQNPQSQT